MRHPNRRAFVMTVVASGSALATSRASAQASAAAAAAAAPILSATDPQAVALGYNPDTTKVDNVKYKLHGAAQMCGGCNFYQGKPTDAMAPCQLFAGKQVAGKGWCSAYAKKGA